MARIVTEQTDPLPAASDQQYIAGRQLFLGQIARQGPTPAADAQHAQVVAAAERGLTQGLADQFRVRRQQYLNHAQILDQILALVVLDRQVGQAFGRRDGRYRVGRTGQIEDVAGMQFGSSQRRGHLVAEWALALDSDQGDAIAAAQAGLRHGLARQGRIRFNAQPVRLPKQVIAAAQFLQGLPAAHAARAWRTDRQQAGTDAPHVGDAQPQRQQADRRDAEEAEGLQAGGAQGIVHHQIGRRGDQGQQAAEQGGKGQRHHQPPGSDAGAVGDAQHHRNEDCHHAGRAHERAQSGYGYHQQHQQPGFAGAGHPGQPVADLIGDASAYQALADHEQPGDQHHHGVTKAGHCHRHRQDIAQAQRHDHQQGHDIWPQPVRGKQHHGHRQHAKDK